MCMCFAGLFLVYFATYFVLHVVCLVYCCAPCVALCCVLFAVILGCFVFVWVPVVFWNRVGFGFGVILFLWFSFGCCFVILWFWVVCGFGCR